MTNTANKPLDWYAERTAYFSEFMSEERRQVLQRTLDSRTRYMTILTENTYHAQNASALVRHCEAFGVQDIHTIETRCKFNPNVNIVRGTDKWIDLHRHRTTAEAIADLKGRGYRIVATTPHREDKTPETFDVAASPFVLVFGTEHAGISDEIVAAADEFLRIPMCGIFVQERLHLFTLLGRKALQIVVILRAVEIGHRIDRVGRIFRHVNRIVGKVLRNVEIRRVRASRCPHAGDLPGRRASASAPRR